MALWGHVPLIIPLDCLKNQDITRLYPNFGGMCRFLLEISFGSFSSKLIFHFASLFRQKRELLSSYLILKTTYLKSPNLVFSIPITFFQTGYRWYLVFSIPITSFQTGYQCQEVRRKQLKKMKCGSNGEQINGMRCQELGQARP